jgi:hypothetical protein
MMSLLAVNHCLSDTPGKDGWQVMSHDLEHEFDKDQFEENFWNRIRIKICLP